MRQDSSSVVGCYDVLLSDWTDPDNVLENENLGQFGPMIRLTEEEVWRPFEQQYFKKALIQGSKIPDDRTVTWRLDDSRLTITTGGFSWYAAYLEPTSAGYSGILRLHLDYASKEPWAEIELRRTPCA